MFEVTEFYQSYALDCSFHNGFCTRLGWLKTALRGMDGYSSINQQWNLCNATSDT